MNINNTSCTQKNMNLTLFFRNRVCGNSGGAVFTKKNLGPTNMMIVRFNSAQYNTISPGSGFSLTVTADPSGNNFCSH